uniref:Uncharacterized protein n=1 Tax=Rhizophora mucronata TaxID=61149 RepID=A0A2P2N1I3_RHIMU
MIQFHTQQDRGKTNRK